MKFKLAHKRSGKESWNISSAAQRRKLIDFLESLLNDLKPEDAKIHPLEVEEVEKKSKRKSA